MDTEITMTVSELEGALRAAIRLGEHNATALIDSELMVRDLKTAIGLAIEAIDRKSYATARAALKQALDEMPWPQRKRGWER